MTTLKQKELELFNQYRSGDNEARTKLLTSLKPLIRGQANKFTNSGLPPMAIELEAHRLASDSLNTYDPSKAQLNTHVTNWLKKLSRFVTNYQNVGHIPEPRALIIGKYNAIFDNLEADKGREPTITELADAMNLPPVEIERLQTELRKDLSISLPEDKEDIGGFYFHAKPGSFNKSKEALEFTYFDADPIDKKILEYTFGIGGQGILRNKDIQKE